MLKYFQTIMEQKQSMDYKWNALLINNNKSIPYFYYYKLVECQSHVAVGLILIMIQMQE